MLLNSRTIIVNILISIISVKICKCVELTPPYFNLAKGKHITASATCGEPDPDEIYCKLIGANADHLDTNFNYIIIQGQICDVCNPNIPGKYHPASYAVDETETFWLSPPLSRDMKYNEVNLTIDFGQEFHVAYVFITMGISPRPELWILEKSSDYGKTWKPWQYFAGSIADCKKYFGDESLKPISRDDSVICTTEYSKIVPLENGEIPISILNNRPSANNYFNSTVLQEWTRATNVRFRFLRTKNLLGHLMSVVNKDPTVTRRYFYSIKDISIGGRCMCNGHASTCYPEKEDSTYLVCECQHNTYGPQCASCRPGFEQKAWKQSTNFEKFICEPCNCFNHTTECVYNKTIDDLSISLDIHGKYEGGGVCQNCQDNTEGINCNKCKPTFYRPWNKHWNETDVCRPCNCYQHNLTGNCAEGSGKCECRVEYTPPNCDSCSYGYFGYPNCRPCECHLNGTRGGQCEPEGGQCHCKQNFSGKYCKQCANTFYGFPKCLPCECNAIGSQGPSCNQTSGNCSCLSNYAGRTCDQCENGYYKYPTCTFCNCDNRGTEPGICNKENGKCLCKEGFGGERCDQCLPGYYGFPDCRACNCSNQGSASSVCDVTGKCPCQTNYAGKTCTQCSPGYYKYPECIPCNCDSHGAIGVSCDENGKCQCNPNFDNDQCSECKDNFYNFPICEACNCNPDGVISSFSGCGSVPPGELCQCKERVQGRICNECKPLYWNLNRFTPEGCDECNCHIPGVIGAIGVCNPENGQCPCKPSVTGQGCTECKDGFYNLDENNLFGCINCGCDVGGSINGVCNNRTGQCTCQPRITGRQCNEPLATHYFPTLFQHQYEMEDGRTPQYTPVRYGFNENIFANYSWKGYALFSPQFNEIIMDVEIRKSALYRVLIRYVNLNDETVFGNVVITPEDSRDVEQHEYVVFKPTQQPSFVTVSGKQLESVPYPFVLNPGVWSINFKINNNLFVDYFVLLPEAYYQASILTQKVESPCLIGNRKLCRHYAYPNVSNFDTVRGEGAFIPNGERRDNLKDFVKNYQQLNELGVNNRVPLLNNNQQELRVDLTLTKPGRYVLVVNYLTPEDDPRTHEITVEISNRNREIGKVVLYSCAYSWLCRQVIIDRQNRVAVFNFDSNFVGVNLKGPENSNVGISSVVAIPYDQWSIDYIQPKSVCVRRNKKCLPTTFSAAGLKKIPFELDNQDRVSKILPPFISDNSSKLILLDHKDAMIDIKSKVSNPGRYVFVVHHYQPEHPEIDLDVIIQDGQQVYEAKLPVSHCPSNSGCRSLVKQTDGNTVFPLTENFMITFKESNQKNVWLDYLLVVPAEEFKLQYIKGDRFDQTSEFISTCGANNFYVNGSDPFCRESVFSLTAHYNDGALPCGCDSEGSTSFECEKFGGQCKCKPNIIGRKCEMCKTGYYGFPDCQPCNCPSSIHCGDNGECNCPSNVIGEKCDKCKPLTFGFDQSIGCEECKCNSNGVENNNLQCDLLSGMCSCKQNIVGQHCDKCAAGFYAFPYCEECECDERGTTEDICDQSTAECLCKPNVYGGACDICKDGTFNLQESNPDGCTSCFCFERASRCSSSNLYKSKITDMNDWKLVAVDYNDTEFLMNVLATMPEKLNETSIGADLTIDEARGRNVFFAAPKQYLGNKITAYGGNLAYTIFYTTQYGSAIKAPDVILIGNDMHLIHESVEQPAATADFMMDLMLTEQYFSQPNGKPATRKQIMIVLENLTEILIKASYWEKSVTTRLLSVSLDNAGEKYEPGLELASSVEQCVCPPGYKGLSCEECAPGYYRIGGQGPFGYCVQCQCNGHTNECDVNTGMCLDCKHNTTGDHCEKCISGYHGDATHGTPMDCLICACPKPQTSNNFATACDISPDGQRISCTCKEGYWGARCESCAAGYYGEPEKIGDYCKPCDCSGNIDTNDIESCDTVTGECLKCLNNTSGPLCNICEPGFYGDAIHLKNCISCNCDKTGLDRCDNSYGTCFCKPNVVGEKCDRCEIDHYGFDSGQGCKPCQCSIASQSKQCEDFDGQCKCQPGVTGRTCDRCAPGYWNYTENGCKSCGCNTGYSVGVGCNPQTGQCECLPGVIGEKCDRCPSRWVLIPNQGCFVCDRCLDALLDETDHLRSQLDPVILGFETVTSNFFTSQRLSYINQSVDDLQKDIYKIDPQLIDSTPLIALLESVEQETNRLKRQSEYDADNANSTIFKSNELNANANKIINKANLVSANVHNIIKDVQDIASRFENGDIKIDSALQEANDLLDEMVKVNFDDQENNVIEQLKKSQELSDDIKKFLQTTSNQSVSYDVVNAEIDNFDRRLNDLQNKSREILIKANEVQRLNSVNRVSLVADKIATAENNNGVINQNLNQSGTLLKNASKLLKTVENVYDRISRDQLELHRLYNDLNDTLLRNDRNLDEVRDLLEEAAEHAQNLTEKADSLDDLLTNTRFISEDALEAAFSYPNIYEALNDAKQYAELANDYVEKTLNKLEDPNSLIQSSETESRDIIQRAREKLQKIQQELKPFKNEINNSIDQIDSLNNQNDESLDKLEKELNRLTNESIIVTNLTDIIDNSKIIDDITIKTQNILNNVQDKLPEKIDQTKEISKTYGDVSKNFEFVNKDLEDTKGDVKQIQRLIEEVRPNENENNIPKESLTKDIDHLNQLIAEARDIIDRIDIGVKFFRNTTLKLQNPPNLSSLGTSTKVSFYTKTKNPNGFLLYLGNEKGTRLKGRKADDFMQVDIENGYPVLHIDLGNGPEKIISSKKVDDDQWYQIIVERTGKNVKLTVRDEDEHRHETKYETEAQLAGLNSIFNLDQEQSSLFVGGFPSTFPTQLPDRDVAFEGEIDELEINGNHVSLWNFDEASENGNGAVRDRLVGPSPSNGYRFGGKGYAKLPINREISPTRSTIYLEFKTTAKEGLLFLIGKDDSFLSIELRQGHVVYQFKSSGDPITATVTQDLYNDNRWHSITAIRDNLNGKLIVGKQAYVMRSVGQNPEILLDEYMYFGGYPDKHNFEDVTNIDFDGCIVNVTIERDATDLSLNEKAIDVQSACPDKFSNQVSFPSDQQGYLKYPNATSGLRFEISLSFRTTENKNALLFYVTNDRQNETLALSIMNDGDIVLQSQNNYVKYHLPKFNDGEKNVVTAIYDYEKLQLFVNDNDHVEEYQNLPSRKLTYKDIYFGGIPSNLDTPQNVLNTRESFTGCIEDATLNGVIVNFANVDVEKDAVTLGTCNQTSFAIPEPEKESKLSLPNLNAGDKEDEDGFTTDRETTVSSLPVTKLPAPTPFEGCVLPPEPAIGESGYDQGYRFGTNAESRVEYDNLIKRNKNKFEFTLDFKSNQNNGIIFYAADEQHMRYVALYLTNGQVHFKINVGIEESILLVSEERLNDNQWHNIKFEKHLQTASLVIDQKNIQQNEISGQPKLVQLEAPYYLGGINPNIANEVLTNLGTSQQLIGCVRNFKINGDLADEYRQTIVGAIPCSDLVEPGVFFESSGCILKVAENFNVGLEIDIKMEIKARNPTGFLIGVHGRRDYLVLHMVDGVVKLTVDNGKVPFEAVYNPPTPHYFCDGNWHTIQALKSKNVATLSVDKVFTDPVVGTGSPATKTKNGLFIGSHPYLQKLRGFTTRKPYNGCIRNVAINNKEIDLNSLQSFGNCTLNFCPTN